MAPTKRSSKGPKETTPIPFGPPFDDADADTILRSSDQVDFYVFRVMLSKTSPFFKSMFSLPQPDTGVSKKQTSIISLTENSRTIAVLLSSIYPTVPTKFVPLDVMTDALVAARKYDMDVVSQCLVQKFAQSEVVRDGPVEAFCAMCSHELGEAARVAAKASLKHRLNLDIIGDKLPYLNGPALHQLWKFHRACSATAAKAVSGTHLTWIANTDRTCLYEDFEDFAVSTLVNLSNITVADDAAAELLGPPGDVTSTLEPKDAKPISLPISTLYSESRPRQTLMTPKTSFCKGAARCPTLHKSRNIYLF
ncbi:hypothetical protein EDB89DRAFT_2072534 [Lactarius sanguifluus]|nr:hypothetical protein EDB89DRAFT_2072534 [Lactarius sanguifluus]